MGGMIRRSITFCGHRTSVALEEEFWQALESLASAQGRSVSRLICDLDAARSRDRSLASLLRVYALNAHR